MHKMQKCEGSYATGDRNKKTESGPQQTKKKKEKSKSNIKCRHWMSEKKGKVTSVPSETTKQPCNGPREAPRCSAGIAINQPTVPSKDRNTTGWLLSSADHFANMGMATHKSGSATTPIPKDLPPLLRARAVALSGEPVGVNIGRERWGYRAAVETERRSGGRWRGGGKKIKGRQHSEEKFTSKKIEINK